ncbi:hypothetical protein GR702_17025 [Novosphingobium sp. FGD1]|uniref:Uncharacterized protein n=1 Tax=Novosphingobium silvae TaxID=2692619 RepID=A0A7X4K8Q7_9SPHN|nr:MULTISPECIES: hypothetical protein [Novosphingobium]MYL99475.1 hypothetical protein [Novosphingobium silvae]GFE76953.1 hypothetical protein NTCA1_46020 [Novosphingobium sp. TCA1]
MHDDLTNVGLRAQATAVGVVQLCRELHGAGLLTDDAIGRIKASIADELEVNAPRSMTVQQYRHDVHARLDRLFDGEAKVGDAQGLRFASGEESP